MTSTPDIFLSGSGFGDAEVYVDGTMTHRLVETDRSIGGRTEHRQFALIADGQGFRTLATFTVTSPDDALAQVRAYFAR